MEKKLTDEEIVKELEKEYQYYQDCKNAQMWGDYFDEELLKQSADLIHRQNAEIERLTEYNANLNGMCLEFTDKNAELKKQVEMWKARAKELEQSWEISSSNEVALQNQLDELRGQLLIAKLQGLTEGYLDGVQAERNAQIIKPSVVELPKEITDKIREQAVKDTAKEIFEWLEKHCFSNGFEIVETYFKERYGVEVEE